MAKSWPTLELQQVLALSTWNTVLERYGTGLLTIPSDRPIAIAGLAKILQPHRNSQYVAGIWDLEFPRQLLWRTVHSTGSRRIARLGPSWSWWGTTSRFQPNETSILDLAEYRYPYSAASVEVAKPLALLSHLWATAALGAVGDIRLRLTGPLLIFGDRLQRLETWYGFEFISDIFQPQRCTWTMVVTSTC